MWHQSLIQSSLEFFLLHYSHPPKTGSHCIAQGGLNFTTVAQTGLELAIIQP